MKEKICLLCCLFPLMLSAQLRTQSSLNGEWAFALDPVRIGENTKWYDPAFPVTRFDKVTVPHSFSVDPRYMFYTGTAWYIKKFNASPVPGNHVSIKFDAVFYKSRVWLNGVLVGAHEGGYTPFEIDITSQLKPENTLAVEVDNSWDTTTIPGAKTAVDPVNSNTSQLVPWINYGGITRNVHLINRPDVHVRRTTIISEPDLVKGTAAVAVSVFLRNASPTAARRIVTPTIFFQGNKVNASLKPINIDIKAGEDSRVEFRTTIPASDTKLWNHDEPNLYQLIVSCGTDTIKQKFGIRKIEVSGTKLLLNGSPIKMGGCNRPLDYPGFGSLDPQQVLNQDLTLIKNGSMELSRISHYPVSTETLDWADQHGLLIITEPGNWQLAPKQLRDTVMREKFRSQFREMIERDFNHPSVIAYSVGNEFPSNTEEGKAWVRDMGAYAKSLDNSRLVTFASMFVFRDVIKKPEDEASQFVDFISANIYGNHLKNLRHIHELYPGKPVYISEFGIRADAVKSEEERTKYLIDAMKDFRQCDFVIGASIWTFNDYFSRFPGTAANGYRPWGLVSPQREIRGMYQTWQEEFSPLVVEVAKREGDKVVVNVTARKDFPSYTVRGYSLRHQDQNIALGELKPGDQKQVILKSPTTSFDVEIIKPGGFVIMTKALK